LQRNTDLSLAESVGLETPLELLTEEILLEGEFRSVDSIWVRSSDRL